MSFSIRENVPLARLTTLKIGGASRFFARAKTEGDVLTALKYAEENDLRVFILGGGSNVLIADEGFNGLVLQIALKGVSIQEEKDFVLVTAQAGEDWDVFCSFCVWQNFQGVECLSGIPGFVGGTPVQNVGAYGQEVSETIANVRVLERDTGRIFEMSKDECGFAYRTSIFNTSGRNRFIVLAVTFRLIKNGAPKIVYKDLREFFGTQHQPTLQETRAAVLKIRAAKSMVIDERDPNSKSAGSFFKNPIVDIEKFVEIERRAKEFEIEKVPNFSVDDKNVKIPAAWLIENAGFYKGYKFGNVGLSTKHTLAIVNLGNAAAKDVLDFKDEIQTKVKEKFDIDLKPEPVFVGFRKSWKA